MSERHKPANSEAGGPRNALNPWEKPFTDKKGGQEPIAGNAAKVGKGMPKWIPAPKEVTAKLNGLHRIMHMELAKGGHPQSVRLSAFLDEKKEIHIFPFGNGPAVFWQGKNTQKTPRPGMVWAEIAVKVGNKEETILLAEGARAEINTGGRELAVEVPSFSKIHNVANIRVLQKAPEGKPG